MRRALALLGSVVVLLAMPAARGLAQSSFPERPIEMIVTFPPGGPTDTAARIVGRADARDARDLLQDLRRAAVVRLISVFHDQIDDRLVPQGPAQMVEASQERRPQEAIAVFDRGRLRQDDQDAAIGEGQFLDEIRPGRTGNDILAASRKRMQSRGIDGTVYSHPVGLHGHGAGPLIGLWDYQDGVPGRGDAEVIPAMWYSIELQATSAVPEWGGQRVWSAQEEDAIISGDGKTRWALRRQAEFHLVH